MSESSILGNLPPDIVTALRVKYAEHFERYMSQTWDLPELLQKLVEDSSLKKELALRSDLNEVALKTRQEFVLTVINHWFRVGFLEVTSMGHVGHVDRVATPVRVKKYRDH
jgi:hypothetical protein